VKDAPTRRLFFALWPDKRMQSALAQATRAITDAADGRAIPAENLHLTLAFLGSVPESKAATLSPIAANVASAFRDLPQGAEPVSITLDKAEHWRKPELLCATATEPAPAAAALAQVLKEALVAGGFAPDLKPFRVHATFARKVRRVSRALTMPAVAWTFTEFRLIESRTDPRGSSYSTVEKWALYKRDR
jgi:RNA 2',3'-cyclic 3'-phosphodiesterase